MVSRDIDHWAILDNSKSETEKLGHEQKKEIFSLVMISKLICKIGIFQVLITSLLLISTVSSSETSYDANSKLRISSEEKSYYSVQTDNPRKTFETFLRLTAELDEIANNIISVDARVERKVYNRSLLLMEQAAALIDQSIWPKGSREQLSTMTVTYLMDILGRIDLPPLQAIPNNQDTESYRSWRIPNTPIRIVKVLEGAREGEYLFATETFRDARRFYRVISHLPLRAKSEITSWSQSIPQLTGPMIPSHIIRLIPQPFKRLWLDTPLWKIFTVLALFIFLVSVLAGINMGVRCITPFHPSLQVVHHLLAPLSVLIFVVLFDPLIAYELNISGTFWASVSNILTTLKYAAIAWFFWRVTPSAFKRITQSKDADGVMRMPLVMIGGKVFAFTGAIIILGVGAHTLGLPVYSVVAGFGIGGLAVALSVRPTLENLIAGVILYLDHPVRVGDHCSFGEHRGTIEYIGIRTVKIRGIDRTLITIPNADFANMELINWAECDMMLIATTIGLRHEIDTDQLRYILVKMREVFHGHPKIDSETVRIRLSGFSSSSIEINIRVYALTREWNEFFAIREDVFFRIKNIIASAGASFSLPAQTLHLKRDEGMDKKRGEIAAAEVELWRQSGKLPFPAFSKEQLADIDDCLDWPPVGSHSSKMEAQKTPEPLSAENEKGSDESRQKVNRARL